MTVHKLSESAISPRLKLIAPEHEHLPETPKPPPPPPVRDVDREARDVAVLVQATATLTALARIVSVRFVLLLAVIGAFVLSLFVIQAGSWPALIVMALYALVVIALVALESGLLARLRG